jgi:hypothetical protein
MPARWAMMLLLVMGVAGCHGMPSVKKEEMDLETSVCGALREPLAFWLFRRAAGAPDAARVASLPDLERLAFTTRDGRRLGAISCVPPGPKAISWWPRATPC